MGQGLYTMLIYGTIDVPREAFEDDAVYDAITHRVVRSNEARPLYLGIPLAVDDVFLQEWYRICAIPFHALNRHVGPRQVVHVTLRDTSLNKQIVRASREWARVQTTIRRLTGKALGEGQLLLVSDWD